MNNNYLLSLAILATTSFFACHSSPDNGKTGQVSTPTENQKVKIIEPEIGYTPDISNDAKHNLQRLKVLYATIDSTIKSYPDYDSAKKHLSQRQIEIYENEEAYSKEDHLDVSIWGCSWYCGGGPDSITASSILAANKKLDYKASNAHDFSLRTAWVEGAPGKYEDVAISKLEFDGISVH